MELRVLRYFLTVAQAESISAAAEVLHVTQPTLSRQLMELEAELGTKLFARGRKKRRMALTEAGSRLRWQAEEILALADKTLASFQGGTEEVAGEVAIGGGESRAMALVARAFQTLHQRHPGILCHLYSGNAQDVTERLDKGLLDFGVLIEPGTWRGTTTSACRPRTPGASSSAGTIPWPGCLPSDPRIWRGFPFSPPGSGWWTTSLPAGWAGRATAWTPLAPITSSTTPP